MKLHTLNECSFKTIDWFVEDCIWCFEGIGGKKDLRKLRFLT